LKIVSFVKGYNVQRHFPVLNGTAKSGHLNATKYAIEVEGLKEE
jgi:hypothetical protein